MDAASAVGEKDRASAEPETRKRKHQHDHRGGSQDQQPDEARHRHDDRRHREDRHRHDDRRRHGDRHHRHDRHASRSERDGSREEGRHHKHARRSRHGEEPREKERQHRATSKPDGDPEARHALAQGKDSSPAAGDGASRPPQPLERDAWMTAPSGIGIDYVHRQRKEKTPPLDDTPQHHISSRELNSETLRHLNQGKTVDDLDHAAQPAAAYVFGDQGSQWRMTKLKGVYTVAEQSGRSIEDVAVERFGSLREFDEAREEREELERRRVYGRGYALKKKPTGDLYSARIERAGGEKQPEQDASDASDDGHGSSGARSKAAEARPGRASAPVDQTALNRLRAQLMKAKLRKAPEVPRLEEEYNQALEAFSQAAAGNGSGRAVVLDASNSRMLMGTRGEAKPVETRRGKQRGLVAANDDMSIDDMVREERRTRGVAGGESLRMAEQIAKDSKFDDDLDYMDENAEKLAGRLHKSEANLKNAAVHAFTKMDRILEACPLCHHEDRSPPQDLPLAPVVSLGTRVYLTLPTEPELTGADGGAVVVPIEHHTNLLECSDEEWDEMRNFMKSLTRLYHDQGRDVLFYENAAVPQRHQHAALVAVPIPYEMGDTAPAFFREAMLSADEEWSQHRKIIDTGKRAREGLGKAAFRRSIAKEMPYFHVWFTLDGGLGHVVEDANRWPKGDLFAREIVGGMLDVDASIIKRQGRWTRSDPRVDGFKRRWRKFDWTRVLTESSRPPGTDRL